MQNINFNASEIAALINKNPYKSQEEALHDLLCRVKKQKNGNGKNSLGGGYQYKVF